MSAYDLAAQVTDPELPMLTLADLGVLRGVTETGDRVVIEMAPTYAGCPALAQMSADLVTAVRRGGYRDVEVRVVLRPPWSSDDITARGRRLLAEHGVAPPLPARRQPDGPVPLRLLAPPVVPPCPRCGSAGAEILAPFGATACKALYRCRECGEPFEYVKDL